jgi:hypothetical protein
VPRARMIAFFLILGGAVFGLLGALHAVYTLLDLRDPRRLVPVDPSVAHAMANSALRVSGGRTDMWRAWMGFNFSHSLGVLLVAGLALWAGFRFNTLPVGIITYVSGRSHTLAVDYGTPAREDKGALRGGTFSEAPLFAFVDSTDLRAI